MNNAEVIPIISSRGVVYIFMDKEKTVIKIIDV